MQKKGYKNIWAIDINKGRIEKAKSKYPSINFKVADVTKLTSTFEDEFFSLMLSFNVSHAVEDKVSMLQRLKAISKEGAILAIFDYYLKDETSLDDIKSLSGKKMYPIKLSHFKMMMKIVGWEIIEESEVTDKYKFWYNAMLEKIAARADMIKGLGYTDDEIKIVIEKFQHLLEAIDTGKLGGIILIAKKV
jgi:ubiquinone/menaquinone biosynthesis C-methylase UbiE